MRGSSSQDKSKSKSESESPEMSRQSESDHNKSEGSVRDTTQSKENPEQQVLSPKQVEIPTHLIHPAKLLRIELEKEWEKFNEFINTVEENVETPKNPAQITTEMVIEIVVNAPETKHIPIASSSKIILNID